MGSPVDPVSDALDRLRQLINKSRATYVPGTPEKYPLAELRGLTILEAEALLAQAEQLREELLFTARRPDDQEKIDAWWRARSEVKVDGNSRAEYVLQRDAAWERVESAEAEVRQLREGLLEAETGFNDISLILEAENEDYQERAYRRAVEEWRHIRALLAGSEAEPVRREVKVDPAMFGESNRLLGEPDGGGAK